MLSNSQTGHNLSVCIDEYDDEVIQSIKGLKSLKFSSYSILNVNGRLLSDITSTTLDTVKSNLTGSELFCVALNVGYRESPTDAILDAQFSIANYFKSRTILFGLNKLIFKNDDMVKNYFDMIIEKSVSFALVPMLDVSADCYFSEPDALTKMMERYKKLRILYDPCRFMERSNTRPYHKWWKAIQPLVYALVLRDYKTGYGFYPIGQGDCNLVETSREFMERGGRNLIFRPSLGRRYGNSVGKKQTFELALECYMKLIGNNHVNKCQ